MLEEMDDIAFSGQSDFRNKRQTPNFNDVFIIEEFLSPVANSGDKPL